MVQKHSFDSHSFKSSSFTDSASQLYFYRSKFSSPKISASPKSSISDSPTNHNNFPSLIPFFIKSSDSKPACAPPQASHLLPFSIKSCRRLFQSSTQACQSIISQDQKVFNSASLSSLFAGSELPFQLNATYATSARLLFILMENNRSLVYLITEFIHIFQTLRYQRKPC